MRQLQITPLDGYDPEIGRWMWALQDVRRRYTLRLVKDLDERLVDWEGPDGQENAIGSLLYHIALVEMDWLYGECHLPSMSAVWTAAAKSSSGNSRRSRPTNGAGCAGRLTSRKSTTMLHPSGRCSILSNTRQAMRFRSVH